MIRRLIRRFKPMALVRFAAGGLISSGVTLGTTAFLHEITGVRETMAAGYGLAAALVVNFLVLRFFVFRGTAMPVPRQLAIFLGSSGVFRGLEYVGFLAMHALGVQYLLALVLVLGMSFIVKFLVYDKLVFARKAEPSPVGETEPQARPR